MNKKVVPLVMCIGAFILSGCATKYQAPIEDLSSYTSQASRTTSYEEQTSIKPYEPGVVKDSGRTHTVSLGDTLYNISTRYGVDVRSLASLNSVTDPTQLRLGQVLRLPQSTMPVKTEATEEVRVTKVASVTEPEKKPAITNTTYSKNPPKTVSPKPAPAVVPGTKMLWPARGPILSDFAKNGKGIDIGGQVGDVVVASAAGEVIFAGDGVRGYGNLVIIKHSPTIVTAYGHNSKLSVKKDDKVSAGQKIAELGSVDAKEPMVRFEVRESGVPVDPAKFLAPRR